jgi:hypothetical protein
MKTVLSYIETQKIAVINRNLSIPVNDAWKTCLVFRWQITVRYDI